MLDKDDKDEFILPNDIIEWNDESDDYLYEKNSNLLSDNQNVDSLTGENQEMLLLFFLKVKLRFSF